MYFTQPNVREKRTRKSRAMGSDQVVGLTCSRVTQRERRVRKTTKGERELKRIKCDREANSCPGCPCDHLVKTIRMSFIDYFTFSQHVEWRERTSEREKEEKMSEAMTLRVLKVTRWTHNDGRSGGSSRAAASIG